MSQIIWVAIILYFSYQAYKWWISNQPENRINKLEQDAEFWRGSALEDPLKLGKELDKYVLDATERDYLHLKERYKHDVQKRLELAVDWSEYAKAVRELSSARDMLDVDWSNKAYDNFEEKVKEPHIKRHEIEKRFQELLGGKFIDRWNQYSERNPSPSFLEVLEKQRKNLQK